MKYRILMTVFDIAKVSLKFKTQKWTSNIKNHFKVLIIRFWQLNP